MVDHACATVKLGEQYMAVPHDEWVGLQGLIDAIASDRARARADLAPVLDARCEAGPAVAALHRFAGKAKARRGQGRARVGRVAGRALDDDLERFAACAALLDGPGGAADAFHAHRIAGKKLRYTMELFAPALGEDTDALLAALKALQALLGELHDRDC